MWPCSEAFSVACGLQSRILGQAKMSRAFINASLQLHTRVAEGVQFLSVHKELGSLRFHARSTNHVSHRENEHLMS